jgi:hypothetical protein
MDITEPNFDEAEITLLRECLESRWVTQGPFFERFERLIAEKQGLSTPLRARHALPRAIWQHWCYEADGVKSINDVVALINSKL